ncbi:urea ABC transporter permease subunit UrtB [Arcobacter cloacae]|uniref:Urea ABC transporter permease subunit UrtB n=1 Tax=Arcobacter cloacae TaxID=1054034 RepID=A0A6M8NP98_9BACT|nr:urea ABC transporter permease subunit UrtB [Arcobacter cloacae]QKF89414.1 urea ABC transporter UrtABCDE, permease protein [Arcobacter cloacae]RXI39465.1 urea ABC transporter permease subunit UrtB [Arcobacter cloacae]
MNILKIILLNLLIFSFSYSSTFEELSSKLSDNSFKVKEDVLNELIINYKDEQRLEILLQNMLLGNLYFQNQSNEILFLEKDSFKSLFTNNTISNANQDDFSKVKINNKLRSVIKASLAKINLFASDENKRLKAAKNILENLEEQDKEIILEALKSEKKSSIKDILLEANTNLNAKFETGEEQLKAIEELGSFLSSKSLETLNSLKESNDEKIKIAVSKALKQIETSKTFYSFIETAFFGLSQGSVLLLAAIGLAITFGVMKVINMAHGELIMIGAYTTYTIQQLMPNLIEYSIIIAIPAAFIVSGIVGILIERLVIRHLYGRPLETLLATFGISLILQQVVRTIFSPLNQEVKTPSWMSGALEINSALSLTYNRLYIVIFAFIVFFAILYVMKKTSLGLKVRAVSQNRSIARAMGIQSSKIDAITFGIGSGIAGVAGVALSQLTNVGPNLGQAYIVDSFMVVVFGGVGNLWGTLIASFTLGEINKFIEPLAGAVLAKVIILIFIILFIQKRPRGLFPQKGRDAQD